MTREKRRVAPSATYRAASLLTGIVMLVGLAGCGNNLVQGDTNASLTQKAKPSVAFSPVQGVSPKYASFASKASDQLAASVKEKGVPVVEAKDAEYIVKAAYVALPEAKKGTKVTYDLDVTDKAGNRVRHIQGEELVSPKRGGDSWAHVTDEGMQKVALKAGGDLNAWIDNPSAPAAAPVAVASAPVAAPAAKPVKTAAAKPAKPVPALSAAVVSDASAVPATVAALAPAKTETVAIVPAVTGAPGDGKSALTDAMRKALAQEGIKVASAASPGAYQVQGQVEMGAVSNGQQLITIRWRVMDPSGKAERAIIQTNKVPEGSLDGNWGEAANLAARGAAPEVLKLMGKPAGGQAQQGSTGSTG